MTIPASEPVRLALHPGQVGVYQSKCRYRTVVAGRRWGKTHLSRVILIAAALKTPGRYWYLAPTREMAKDIMWQAMKQAIDPSWMVGFPLETELSVRLVNGSSIRLFGADEPDRLRGRAVSGVVCDEYADMKPVVWTEVLRPALADTGGWAVFPGTPKSFNHFYEMYQLGQDPARKDYASWQYRTVDNTAVPGLVAEAAAAKADSDPRTYRQEWEASFEAMAGRAYYAFDRKHHVGAVGLERGLDVAISFDFNLTPATAIIGQAAGQECRVWRESWITGAGGEATKASALAVKKLLRDANWTGNVRIYGDPSGRSGKTTGPSDHAVIRDVFPHATWAIPSAAPHVRDRVAAVNTRCETMDGRRHMRIDPTCVRLIADLEQVIFKPNGDLDQTSTPMLTHISDAAGYWIHGVWPVQKPKGSVGTGYYEHLL
jgi:hypothetical protein